MGIGKNKGGSYEREICVLLSKWWTNGKDTDVFWRTSSSGGRAKTRSKKNLKTFGQNGDIQATNPIGQSLIDVCSIEVKRGYSKNTFAEIIDKKEHSKEQEYEKFINQAIIDSKNAGSHCWLLIVRRNGRKAMIFMPASFRIELKKLGCKLRKKNPIVFFNMTSSTGQIHDIFGMLLDDFLQEVQPFHIKKIRYPLSCKLKKKIKK